MSETQKAARFEFPPELSALLRHSLRGGEFVYEFNGPQTAKHLIEALGIPHTEVGALTVNGESRGLGYLVQDGDHLQAFACQYDPANRGRLTPPRFILDGHLGRLTAYLRILGLDCLYRNDYSDPALVAISMAEGRILLTRDRRLLMHKAIQDGCLIRSLDPKTQLREVVQRYNLSQWIRPFRRCLRCNHELQPVEKQAILERLLPLTRLYFDEFQICPNCQQIYWKGSHYERMRQLVHEAASREQDST